MVRALFPIFVLMLILSCESEGLSDGEGLSDASGLDNEIIKRPSESEFPDFLEQVLSERAADAASLELYHFLRSMLGV